MRCVPTTPRPLGARRSRARAPAAALVAHRRVPPIDMEDRAEQPRVPQGQPHRLRQRGRRVGRGPAVQAQHRSLLPGRDGPRRRAVPVAVAAYEDDVRAFGDGAGELLRHGPRQHGIVRGQRRAPKLGRGAQDPRGRIAAQQPGRHGVVHPQQGAQQPVRFGPAVAAAPRQQRVAEQRPVAGQRAQPTPAEVPRPEQEVQHEVDARRPARDVVLQEAIHLLVAQVQRRRQGDHEHVDLERREAERLGQPEQPGQGRALARGVDRRGPRHVRVVDRGVERQGRVGVNLRHGCPAAPEGSIEQRLGLGVGYVEPAEAVGRVLTRRLPQRHGALQARIDPPQRGVHERPIDFRGTVHGGLPAGNDAWPPAGDTGAIPGITDGGHGRLESSDRLG